ncbi:MAG: hypothetical protein V3S07_04950, partial [Micropepsaceae bacterium]
KLDPEGMAQLSISDLRESRLLLVDPAPIPDDERRRTFEWMKSWDFLETHDDDDSSLVNEEVQSVGNLKTPDEARVSPS